MYSGIMLVSPGIIWVASTRDTTGHCAARNSKACKGVGGHRTGQCRRHERVETATTELLRSHWGRLGSCQDTDVKLSSVPGSGSQLGGYWKEPLIRLERGHDDPQHGDHCQYSRP